MTLTQLVEVPDDSARGSFVAGWLIVLIFFAGLGGWAMTAPLNAAVVGEAVVKIDGNRKSVQFWEGGKVRDIRVVEGATVAEGDVLLVFDDTASAADAAALDSQLVSLSAVEARLEAERLGLASIPMPAVLVDRKTEPAVAAALEDQRLEFNGRKSATESQRRRLEARLAQTTTQSEGLAAQRPSIVEQLDSVSAELAVQEGLLKNGLSTRGRVADLRQRQSALTSALADLDGQFNMARVAATEAQAEIDQLNAEHAAKIVADLRDVRAKLAELAPRLAAANERRDASVLRSPYAGTIVDLAVFSVGAVVRPGDRVLDIVPHGEQLGVEARLRVEDISEVRPGMAAQIHFTSYSQRTTPVIGGTVVEISADRLTDARTQMPYYVAKIAVDPTELASNTKIQLYPGMPATVMITTHERTALDYLLGPLTASFDRGFKER